MLPLYMLHLALFRASSKAIMPTLQDFWKGRFDSAVPMAFSDNRAVIDSASPAHLAARTGIKPVAPQLLIHSPGDDWVPNDSQQYGSLLGALATVDASGKCASGQHEEMLSEPGLASCILSFMSTVSPVA